MLKCWEEKPENRPPFFTLRQDLDDFDTAIEQKYHHYEAPAYKKTEKRGRKKGGKEGKREDAMAARKKNVRRKT